MQNTFNMTREEAKQITLKNLCMRLPYRVRCKCINGLDGSKTDHGVLKFIGNCNGIISNYYEDIPIDSGFVNNMFYPVENIKPHLRPLSSMTEEEGITIFKIIYGDDTEFSSVEVSDNCIEIWNYDYNEDGFSEKNVYTIYFEEIVRSMEVLDYLLSHHFDIPHWIESEKTYKTMIEMDLALEAPEDMYNFK